jgi:two-component system sensor histidine kinase/response regulator
VHHNIATKRVLVVDDNEVNRHLLMRLLPDWGLEPVCAFDGFKALELFQQSQAEGNPFPLVLLDQNMPRMDGYAVAERIRQLAPMEKVAIVILTSAPHLDDHARDQRLGIDRKIAKPLRRAALQDAVFQALDIQPPPEVEGSHPAAEAYGNGLRLLLAEDNSVNQTLAIRVLEKLGHHVVLAVNGVEAIEMLRRKTLRPCADGYTDAGDGWSGSHTNDPRSGTQNGNPYTDYRHDCARHGR